MCVSSSDGLRRGGAGRWVGEGVLEGGGGGACDEAEPTPASKEPGTKSEATEVTAVQELLAFYLTRTAVHTARQLAACSRASTATAVVFRLMQ